MSLVVPSLFIAGSSGSALSNATIFTVDGVERTNGATINLANGTGSVTIAAAYGGSIEDLTGNTGIGTGDNTCTFTVRAEDGVTTLGVTLNLHVLDTGLNEITEINVLPDTDGDRHGTDFRIENASGQRAIVLNCGARAQRWSYQFYDGTAGPTSLGADGGAAIGISYGDSESGANVIIATAGDPPSPVSAAGIAAAFVAYVNGVGWGGTATHVGDGLVRMASNTVNASSSVEVNAGTKDYDGRDAAGAVPGVTSIIVNIDEGAGTETIGTAITDATNGMGWTVVHSGGDPSLVTFTDSAVGPRGDATNNGAVNTITVTQQGADPA